MRNAKELLQIVIDSLKKGDKTGWFNRGICGEIENLMDIESKITPDETDYLWKLLGENKPRRKNKFARYTESYHWTGGLWWWRSMYDAPETRQIRIEYLTELKDSL